MGVIDRLLIVIVSSIVIIAAATESANSRREHVYDGNIHKYSFIGILEQTCTNIMPVMQHFKNFNPIFGNLTTVIQPICDYLIQEADDFDTTDFCYFIVDYMQGIGARSRVGRDKHDDFQHRLRLNVTRNLYGIDSDDVTTVCPNADKIFQPSLVKLYKDLVTEYYTEVLTYIIPWLEDICPHRLKIYFLVIGLPNDSPYERLVDSLLDIASEFAGYESFANFCYEIEPWFNQDYASRREISHDIIISMRDNIYDALDIF